MISLYTIYTIQQYEGLSTDTKPTTGIPNGARFFEMDTAKTFMFDADSSTWLEYTGTIRW
jgi:hypothetical protein